MFRDGAGRFAVAGHVEPVPAPAFAERRRRQQPVHHALESRRRTIVEERLDLVGRRRQAGQVERHPAEQGQLVGVADRLEPFFAPCARGGSGRCRLAATPRRATAGTCGSRSGCQAQCSFRSF